MPQQSIPYISAEAIRSACSMEQAIEAMRAAFADLSSGQALVPLRTQVPLGSDASALFMPSHSRTLGRHTVKIASVHPGNPVRHLDLIQATVIHFDSDTGKPIAVLEGRSITAIRTGAGSGLATDLMAKADACVVVIIGAGIQAETQLEAVCCVRPIQKIYCLSRSKGRAVQFAAKMSQRVGVQVEAATDRSVLREADIICTATTSDVPILDLADVTPGVHVNAVGTHRPHTSEIGADLVCVSRIVVDHRESCLQEAGEILIPIRSGQMAESHILGELGDLVLGRLLGRELDRDYTLFKSVGNAVQDLFLADLIVNNINEY